MAGPVAIRLWMALQDCLREREAHNGGMRSVIILGAGMSGLTAALELRRREWAVTVADQGAVPHPDAASTDISKVVRADYGDDELYCEMAEQAIAGWRRWNAEWGRELYHECGYLLLGSGHAMRPGGYEETSFRVQARRGQKVEPVHAAKLQARHPQWDSKRYGAGYYNPNAGWVESGAVVARLAEEARRVGIELRENAPLVAMSHEGGRVTGVVLGDGARLRGDVVVSTLGAWTPFVFPELGTLLRTTGQAVVHFKPNNLLDWAAPAFPVWAADIEQTGRYGFPVTADGIVKVAKHGAGVPVTRPDQKREVTEADVAETREFLRGSLPALADAPVVATRQCWYGDALDGDFLIDRHPTREGLFVVGGDSGHGFKFAPVIGGLIADVVEGKPNAWAKRFKWRTARPKKEAARAS